MMSLFSIHHLHHPFPLQQSHSSPAKSEVEDVDKNDDRDKDKNRLLRIWIIGT